MLDKVLRIIDALNKYEVDYVIIGGYAVILHGFLRATEDLDILLAMDKENISKFQNVLRSLYADDDISEINFEELRKYPVIRYGTPDDFYIDIISSLGTEFSFSNISKIKKSIDGIDIYFASVESLYNMKKNTYREKDKIDLMFLKEKLKDDSKI